MPRTPIKFRLMQRIYFVSLKPWVLHSGTSDAMHCVTFSDLLIGQLRYQTVTWYIRVWLLWWVVGEVILLFFTYLVCINSRNLSYVIRVIFWRICVGFCFLSALRLSADAVVFCVRALALSSGGVACAGQGLHCCQGHAAGEFWVTLLSGRICSWEMWRWVVHQDLPLSLPLFITVVNLQEVADPNPDPNPNPPL